MSEQRFRKRIRLEGYDYSSPGAYFVTVCTANRETVLWDAVEADTIQLESLPLSAVGKVVKKGIEQIADHYENVTLDKYCIMPDHVHMLIAISADNGRMLSAPTLSTVVASMKRWVSKQTGRSVWQKSFYEHSVRNQQDYDDIWMYIENNPRKYFLRD